MYSSSGRTPGSMQFHLQQRLGRAAAAFAWLPEPLEARQLLAAPVLEVIPDAIVRSALTVPLNASDADQDRLSYAVASSNPNIKVKLHKGPFLKLTVAHTAANADDIDVQGELVFQLLSDVAPRTVRTIVGLVRGEFYNGLRFHRLADLTGTNAESANIIQGGDPSGNGTGGPPFRFKDEFSRNAIFSGTGQLAMANSGNDQNGSQFFITSAPQRHLDYNHTIFGQLVRGWEVLDQLMRIKRTAGSDQPLSAITITRAEIVENHTDAVMTIQAPRGQSGTVTVTVSDGNGGQSVRTFTVRGTRDTTDQPPFLETIPDQFTPVNTPLEVRLKYTEANGDPVFFGASFVGETRAIGQVRGDSVIVYPQVGYRGLITLRVTVQQAGGTATAQDKEVVVIAVGRAPLNATGLRAAAVAGREQTLSVATFRDADPRARAGDYTVSINWGDGQVSEGQVIKGANGTFTVQGRNAYRAEGRFPLTVSIKGRHGAVAETHSWAVVADAPLTGAASTVIGYAGSTLANVEVATFTDADPRGTAGDFTARINWGDGQASTGVITALGAGKYRVSGTHTYATPGSYPLSVRVLDKGGSRLVANTTARIGRTSLTVNLGTFTAISEGATFNAANLSFADADTAPHTYTATVDYGDGGGPQPLALTADKQFSLSHTYADSGNYLVRVVVSDEAGNIGHAVQTLIVTNVKPTLNDLTGDATGVRGQLRTINLSADDISPADRQAGFRYQINWGDNTDLDSVPTGSTSAQHAFAVEGTYTVTVTAFDKDNTASDARTFTITIVPAELQADPADSSRTALVVGGTGGNDNIELKPAAGGGIEVFFGTTSVGAFNPTGRIQVWGRAGNDRIALDPSISRDAELYGEAGLDTLIGAAGNDILVGGSQADELRGNGGRDILIGGSGADSLLGGGADDILVGGATKYDQSPAGLRQLMAEWARGDLAYEARVRHLLGPQKGLNGLLLSAKAINNDTEIDSLLGEEGRDLFYAKISGAQPDVLGDRASGERVVEL